MGGANLQPLNSKQISAPRSWAKEERDAEEGGEIRNKQLTNCVRMLHAVHLRMASSSEQASSFQACVHQHIPSIRSRRCSSAMLSTPSLLNVRACPKFGTRFPTIRTCVPQMSPNIQKVQFEAKACGLNKQTDNPSNNLLAACQQHQVLAKTSKPSL